MAHIGSVFLGDSRRQRVLSSSSSSSVPHTPVTPVTPVTPHTPSSSSSGTQPTFGTVMDTVQGEIDEGGVNEEGVNEGVGIDEEKPKQTIDITTTPLPPFSYIESLAQRPPPAIDPLMALELRVRLLEGLVVGLDGLDQDPKTGVLSTTTTTTTTTLVKSTENIKRTLNKYVEGNETLRRFMSRYDQYAPYLTPAFALGLLDESTMSNPASTSSSPDIITYIHEMEPEIRGADASMQEIETMLKRGVLDGGGGGEGKEKQTLESYIPLQPRLAALVELHQQNRDRAEALERRVAGVMQSHAGYIDTLSDLFLAWDSALIEAENRVVRLEREKEEKERLGLVM
ncbi:MAG: hypothetical protein NXY57DRAFT_1043497 [Lentinula lateritia]|nr:MAG: hypothetical protein NXY57DRAFT_1043497 [Lentinula lateritia]